MDLSGIREAIAEATGVFPAGDPRPIGGGCINDTLQLGDFFVKLNAPSRAAMFETEKLGLAALAATGAVRVPQPICCGVVSTQSFLVLELLPLGARRAKSQEELGRQLAALHRTTHKSFGWDHDNFIGATPQPNHPAATWIDFFREQRLGAMLAKATAQGFTFERADELLDGLDRFFEADAPRPSLLHGDLWGGNAGALVDGTPVLFDPAVYFGDREADLAMTRLFGGFSSAFHHAYEEAWPLPAGHERRVDLYNLYHILNHAVLFGGGYARQAQGMIDSLLRAI